MAGIVHYAATRSNCLKNWELMNKAKDEKLVFKQDKSTFWTFHKTFSNHIRNMGWEDIMLYRVNREPKDLTVQFREISMREINIECAIGPVVIPQLIK